MKRILAISIILLFIGMSISSSTGFGLEKQSTVVTYGGTTFYVDDDFNESTPGWNVTHFARIQDAIKIANDGDTVFVYNGTYYGRVRVSKSIDLIGEDKDITIIDGRGKDDVVLVSANWVNISGFTLRNSGSYQGSAGIMTDSVRNIVINNNIIIDNEVGINLWNTDTCYIFNNIVSESKDRGLWLEGSNINVSNNIITDNFFGGTLFYDANASFFGNTFTNNGFVGMSISGSAYIFKNIFENNLFGLVTSCFYTREVLIEMNIFIGNIFGCHMVSDYWGGYKKNQIVKNNFFRNVLHASLQVETENKDTFIYFLKNEMCIWDSNYWGRPMFIKPKAIWGVNVFLIYIPNPFGYWGKYIPFPFPIADFDRNPALKPYDIEV